MTTITERAIHGQFAWLGRERGQNFGNHDGTMHASGSLAGRKHFGDSVGVTLRIAFLVFFLEPARVLAGITDTPFMRRRGRRTIRK